MTKINYYPSGLHIAPNQPYYARDLSSSTANGKISFDTFSFGSSEIILQIPLSQHQELVDAGMLPTSAAQYEDYYINRLNITPEQLATLNGQCVEVKLCDRSTYIWQKEVDRPELHINRLLLNLRQKSTTMAQASAANALFASSLIRTVLHPLFESNFHRVHSPLLQADCEALLGELIHANASLRDTDFKTIFSGYELTQLFYARQRLQQGRTISVARGVTIEESLALLRGMRKRGTDPILSLNSSSEWQANNYSIPICSRSDEEELLALYRNTSDKIADRNDVFLAHIPINSAALSFQSSPLIFIIVPHDQNNLQPYIPIVNRSFVNTLAPQNTTETPLLTSQENDYLSAFVKQVVTEEDLRSDARDLFSSLLRGELSVMQVWRALIDKGVTQERAKTYIKALLTFDKPEEVVDRRTEIKFCNGLNTASPLPDRVTFFQRNRSALSEKGLAYLSRLESAVAVNDTEALRGLMADFPSVQKPHLEYYTALNDPEGALPQHLDRLARLGTTQGCSRGCVHCYFAPNPEVRIMPFPRILQILEVAKASGRTEITNDSVAITPYYDTEFFDYYDPVYDADAGDVLMAILTYFPDQHIHLTSRGWYTGNKIAERAMKKIEEACKLFPENLHLRISMDLFDTCNDLARYAARVIEILDAFSMVSPALALGAEDTRGELTQRIHSFCLALSTHFNVQLPTMGVISRMGRAKNLDSPKQYDVGSCMWGTNILATGEVPKKELTPDARRLAERDYIREYQEAPDNDDELEFFIRRRDEIWSDSPGVVVHTFRDSGIRLWPEEEAISIREILPKRTGRAKGGLSEETFTRILEKMYRESQSPWSELG